MTQRNKLWSSFEGVVALTIADQAGNKGVKIGANLLTGTGLLHLAGWTIGPVFLTGMIHNSDGSTFGTTAKAHVGIMIGQGALDDGDFPDLQFGDGDYFLRKGIVMDGGGAISALAKPDQRGIFDVASHSSRRLERIGDTLWLVFQQNTPSDFDYDFQVTFMAMSP